MAGIPQSMASNILNATTPTGTSGAPGSFTAFAGSAMKVRLNSTSSTASAQGTQLTGTGYTAGGTAVPAASTASSSGSAVTLPASSALSWTNGSGGAWSIQSWGRAPTAPVTGYPTQAYSTVYTGKCRVQQRAAVARPREAGEDQLMIVRFELHLPVAGTSDLRVNDEVTLTASAHDPDLLGRMFLVIELAHKSEATARRVGVTERTGS
jgi:hypothetical protein